MLSANSAISSLVLNIANIVVLFILLRLLVYKPVKKFMTARSEQITNDIGTAEKKLAEAEVIEKQCADRLAGATEEAEAEKRRIISEADAHAQSITADAEKKAEEILDSAAVKAAHTSEQMMEDLHDSIADLAVEIAGKVIEREVSVSDNADLIDKFFSRVG